MKLIEIIFKGKYQSFSRGVGRTLFFPKLAGYRLSIQRTLHSAKFGVLIRSNEVMPRYREVGLFMALVLISKVLRGKQCQQ
jgi:hypothetical protein